MKTSKRNFVDSYIPRAIALGLFSLACVSGMSYAASDNGCGVSSNSYINPEIALCSTHVYNIRQTKNPSDATSKQAMRDVIALKTTLMTQQLEQQYDFLEATVSRLKTQLQKAVLTTNLEAAGASSSSSLSGISVSGNNGLVGAENCMTAGLTSDVMNCLSRNLERIASAINNSDIGAAQRQIKTDLQTLQMYDKLDKTQDDLTTPDVQEQNGMSVPLYNAYKECQTAFNTNNKNSITTCMNMMRVCITQNIELLQNQNRANTQVRYIN